jgi:hypothetical protein
MILTYPDGTIVETEEVPCNFTGVIITGFSVEYWKNGVFHRDSGLPAISTGNYYEYIINDETTGQFFIWNVSQ